jgi:hypothetical protein
VVVSVSLPSRVSVLCGVKIATSCYRSMVCRRLVIASLVLFGRLPMVVGGLGKVF